VISFEFRVDDLDPGSPFEFRVVRSFDELVFTIDMSRIGTAAFK